jgi:hypothetical protein
LVNTVACTVLACLLLYRISRRPCLHECAYCWCCLCLPLPGRPRMPSTPS